MDLQSMALTVCCCWIFFSSWYEWLRMLKKLFLACLISFSNRNATWTILSSIWVGFTVFTLSSLILSFERLLTVSEMDSTPGKALSEWMKLQWISLSETFARIFEWLKEKNLLDSNSFQMLTLDLKTWECSQYWWVLQPNDEPSLNRERTTPVHEQWEGALVWIITSLPSDLTFDDDWSTFMAFKELSLEDSGSFTYPLSLMQTAFKNSSQRLMCFFKPLSHFEPWWLLIKRSEMLCLLKMILFRRLLFKTTSLKKNRNW